MERGQDGTVRAPGADLSSAEFQNLGKRFVSALYRNLKLTQIFDRRNEAILQPLEELLRVSADLAALGGGWELKLHKGYLHLNDVRLRAGVEIFMSYHYVMDEFRRRGLGSLSFRSTAVAADIVDFLYAFRDAGKIPPAEMPFDHLHAKLKRPDPAPILVAPLAEDGFSGQFTPEDVRQRSVTTFFKAVYLARGVLSAVQTQRVVHVRRAKRLVTSLVDILAIDESVLMGLTNIKGFVEYTFNHSVNVCVLSLAVGRRLGLKRRQLGELGLSALFHDLGKTTLPRSLLNKTGQLDKEEMEQMMRHPVNGVKQLINIKGLSGVTAKLMISVFRHHNNIDGSGYPPLNKDEELSLYSRIIRIADSYDAMTSKRIYRRDHCNNVEAIEELWSLAGRHFDPALLKIFISTVGVFPVGSLVQLNTGEIAMVLKNSYNSEFLLSPLVRTLATWENSPHTPCTIDLSTDPEKKIYGYFQGSEAEALLPTLLL
jgi:HD-GYP domain-containing protein (c-di-GMP phosphodiesterase class II)